MKTLKHLFTALLLMVATVAMAHDFEVCGIYYDILSEEKKTVEVTFRGVYSTSYSNEYTGRVDIPSSVISNGITYAVISIGDHAFYGCTGLTSVTIGNSVTSIGDYAFSFCSGLTSVTIGNSVTSIGDRAFKGCSALTNFIIPNGVTSIGEGAFYSCTGLINIVVDEGNSTYDSRDNCNAIIETATNKLIAGCRNTVIPNSVTSIGESAFYGCSGLTSVTIGNSVTSIGDYAFRGCTGLTSIAIPGSVTSIGDEAFYGCTGLTSIAIPGSVTSIGNSAFRGCTGLTSITIGNGVTSIGEYAFCNCSALTSVTIGNSVTSIGEGVFSGCTGLTSITIPGSVTSIGDEAFYYCPGLTSIAIPGSVTSIGEGAFYSCTGLINIVVDEDNSVYDSRDNCNAIIETATNKLIAGCRNTLIPNSVTSIGDEAFYGCTGLTSIAIPGSVTSIGEYAFKGCTQLNKIINLSNLELQKGSTDYGYIAYYAKEVINIPNGSIEGDFGFGIKDGINTLLYYWGNATELTLPGDYKGEDYIIGNYVFSGCTGLASITIPNSVTSIGDWAFSGCTGLANITIPNSVTSIGYEAFYGCDWLKEVHISDLAAWCGIDFEDYGSNPLYYAHNLYLNGELVTELVIPDGVNEIKERAFSYCTGLTSVTIGNSVTSIGNSAFRGCSGLTSITIPNNVTSIGYEAFYGCSSLTNVTIPNSVTSIGDYAFRGCTGLTSIAIPGSVTSIGDYAFGGCTGLINIVVDEGNSTYDSRDNCNAIIETATNKLIAGCRNTVIPNSVTSIGDYAFRGCTGLTSVTIGNSVTSIGEGAFSGCIDLTSVTIPNSVTSIGYYVFGGCTGLTSITSLIPAERLFACDSKQFNEIDKANCTLYVPHGAKETYVATAGWNEFVNIVELESTDIDGVKEQMAENKTVYGLQGRKVDNPTNGIYIINGKKVFVK